MAKKCPPGKYYCFDDKKCKKIPRGYHIGARGYLARDDDNETKKNGNGNSNGNGNGGNGAGNGNGGSGGGANGNGGGMGEEVVYEKTMTPSQKRKDTMLKKKYDKSDMKKSMQKQYGKEEGKKVYFATIRKQAMEEVIPEAKVDKGRSDYGKASIRNYRRMGPGHGEPGMFDPEGKRGKTIDKRREEHKARRGVKGAKVPAYKVEEVEQIDELSKETLISYGHKAFKDKKYFQKAKRAVGDSPYIDKKIDKRNKGMDLAIKKLNKEEVVEDYETKKKEEIMGALKKRDLKQKVKEKIAADIIKRKGDVSKSDDRYAYESVEPTQDLDEKCWPGYEKKGMKTMFGKRYPNCVKKKTKSEEVEFQEKLDLKKADMGDVVKDFYKSDAPQFKGRSKEKRREMAIAAKLTAERGKLPEDYSANPAQQAAIAIAKKERKQDLKVAQKKKMKEEVVTELNRFEKEKGMDTKTGKPVTKGGTAKNDRAFQSVMKKFGKQRMGANQPKKVRGAKNPNETSPTKQKMTRMKAAKASSRAFETRAKKAGYKTAQDYANVVARYGSEDNMKKGRGLGT